MDDDQTLEVSLPWGTRPNPDLVVTQEIPRVAETLEMPRETFVVQTLPTHLLGDPILTMDAPRADDTPLYDQLNPRPPRSRRRPRRRMRTADRVLAGMSAAAIAGVTMIYGIVAYGWGAGPMPVDARPQPSHTVSLSTPTEPPAAHPTSRHVPRPRPTEPVVVVVAQTHFAPSPIRSATPTPTVSPTRTSESPSAPQTSSSAPEPTQTTQSPSGTPSETPTASQSTTPASPSISLEP